MPSSSAFHGRVPRALRVRSRADQFGKPEWSLLIMAVGFAGGFGRYEIVSISFLRRPQKWPLPPSAHSGGHPVRWINYDHSEPEWSLLILVEEYQSEGEVVLPSLGVWIFDAQEVRSGQSQPLSGPSVSQVLMLANRQVHNGPNADDSRRPKVDLTGNSSPEDGPQPQNSRQEQT